jgi:hypothetical protein
LGVVSNRPVTDFNEGGVSGPMMLSRGVLPMALFIVLAAGCVGSAAVGAGATTAPSVAPLEVTETKGAIDGIVADESILPTANATIHLLTTDQPPKVLAQTASDASGHFAFSLIAPGTYGVRATATGFANGSALAHIVAGEVLRVQIILGQAPAQDPYIITIVKVGYLSCAVGTIIAPTNNRCPTDTMNATIRFDIPEGFRYILTESQWPKSDEELSQYLYTFTSKRNADGTFTNESKTMDDIWGKSILRAGYRPGEVKPKPQLSSNALITYAPVPKGAFRLTVTSYYAGLYAEEINHTAYPVCRLIYDRCAGVGVTLGLKYHQYLSIFIFGAPTDVDRYSAVPDQ